MDLSFFLVVLLVVAVLAILLVLLSRGRAATEMLDEQLATPPAAEDDPELRAEDTAQMLEADNRNRAKHGEAQISATEADVQVKREEAEAEELPEREAQYAEQLDESLARDNMDPNEAERSVDEGARQAAEERLRSDR
ncbi:MAG: hypothetical protein H0U42_03115 [Thermoleophilaceae bacterium]|nr:hypothetical protein [Thermoleophilaceae bacterium]